jgi:3-methyladenine DNA glycosylase/8-oxoguanine DNA glycosylase
VTALAPILDTIQAVGTLREADPVMARLIDEVGPCRLEPTGASPFRALARSIVYQQLSGKAAATILGRVIALFPEREFPRPEDLLAESDERLRGAGLSQNKLRALRDLAEKTLAGIVPSRDDMGTMSDEEIIERCSEVRGVGRWTVEMLLMFHLGRPDVLPVDDLGIRKGAALIYRMRKLPDARRLLKTGAPWRPNRTVASWYLWRATELPPEAIERIRTRR